MALSFDYLWSLGKEPVLFYEIENTHARQEWKNQNTSEYQFLTKYRILTKLKYLKKTINPRGGKRVITLFLCLLYVSNGIQCFRQ